VSLCFCFVWQRTKRAANKGEVTGGGIRTVRPVGCRRKGTLPDTHRRERDHQRVGIDLVLVPEREGDADELHVLGAPQQRLEKDLNFGLGGLRV
jgi:hypothetical protein